MRSASAGRFNNPTNEALAKTFIFSQCLDKVEHPVPLVGRATPAPSKEQATVFGYWKLPACTQMR
jgi:hypothetical protein